MITAPKSLVRVRLNCPSLDHFVERFAANVSAAGMFVPSREPCPVGSTIRFEMMLFDHRVVFSGEGAVTWVKEFDPTQPTSPHGMGVAFTVMPDVSVPVLERLLKQREAVRQRQQASLPVPVSSPTPPGAGAREAPPTSPISESSGATNSVPAPALLPPLPGPGPGAEASPGQAEPPAKKHEPVDSSSPSATPPASGIAESPQRTRIGALLAWSAAVVAGVLVAILLTRGPPGDASLRLQRAAAAQRRAASGAAREPQIQPAASSATAPPPENDQREGDHAAEVPLERPAEGDSPTDLPMAAIVEGSSSPVPAPPEKKSSVAHTRAPSIHIESILTGPLYEGHTCPQPTSQFSFKTQRSVNVCISVAPMSDPVTEEVTVIWERNGAFLCQTKMHIVARHITSRTRAHVDIDERRVGDWSVRILSRKGIELARSSFRVGS
jgi:Tfp pilus assembly protein PilZ